MFMPHMFGNKVGQHLRFHHNCFHHNEHTSSQRCNTAVDLPAGVGAAAATTAAASEAVLGCCTASCHTAASVITN